MFKNLTIGQHYPIESKIHSLDPRSKILISIAFIISLFLIDELIGFSLVVGFLALVIVLSKVPFTHVLRGLKPILLIILLTFIINLFMTPGETIWSFGFLSISREGVYQASFMGIRLALLIVGTSMLTLTTSPIMLTDGIEQLLSPFKKIGLPAHELAMMMTIALRFIPTLMQETEKIMKAQKARGADFETGGIIARAKNLIPILVPLFISAFRRADELAVAMESRCYHGGDGRTRMKQLKLRKADFISIVVFLIYGAAIIIFF